MFYQFSIIRHGIEIYHYGQDQFSSVQLDSDLISGFMEALQIFSEYIGTQVKQIKFSNLNIFTQSYGDLSLRLITELSLEISEIESIFNDISKELFKIIDKVPDGFVINNDLANSKIVPLIRKLIELDVAKEEKFCEDTQEISKIAVCGLANAGKTSIIKKFSEKWPIEKLKTIKPTFKIDYSKNTCEILDHSFFLWDFGGQDAFINDYLKDKRLWDNITVLIYIIDLQDPSNFQKSKLYLDEILKALKNKDKTPIFILLHKYDGEKRKDLSQNVSLCIKTFADYLSEYSFFLTSIEDDSSNLAMLKSIYYSIPTVIIAKLFQEHFFNEFLDTLVPKLVNIVHNQKRLNFPKQDSKDIIYQIALNAGIEFGNSLQKVWFDYISNNWAPKTQNLSRRSIQVIKTTKTISIKVPYFEIPDLSNDLLVTAFNGIFDGIAKTFGFEKPKMEESVASIGKWTYIL